MWESNPQNPPHTQKRKEGSKKQKKTDKKAKSDKGGLQFNMTCIPKTRGNQSTERIEERLLEDTM